MGLHVLKNFPAYYEMCRFIIMSQDSATGTYPQALQLDAPSPHLSILFNMHFNISLSSKIRTSNQCLSLRFSNQTLYAFLFSSIYSAFPAHLMRLDLITNMWQGVQIMAYLMHFSVASCIMVF